MFDIGTPQFLKDPTGQKTSMMRVGALLTVAGGVSVIVGGAFGWAGSMSGAVTPEHALYLVGLGLLGKVVQRGQEVKQAMGETKPDDKAG